MMEKVINEAMNRAIDISIENSRNRIGGPFGAVILYEGKIIAEGSNLVTQEYDPSCHAEIVAIRRACKELKTHDLSGCVLVSSCYNCSMCFSCARWAHIDKIYYCNTREDAANIGFSDVEIYEEIKHKMNGGATPNIIQIKNDDGIKAFEIWNADKDKVKY